uniref:Uncharacterized protein n=1 Tax=viral metagenome TaxID=1070528 RepID=A0A6C0CMK8_9ZZZZ
MSTSTKKNSNSQIESDGFFSTLSVGTLKASSTVVPQVVVGDEECGLVLAVNRDCPVGATGATGATGDDIFAPPYIKFTSGGLAGIATRYLFLNDSGALRVSESVPDGETTGVAV